VVFVVAVHRPGEAPQSQASQLRSALELLGCGLLDEAEQVVSRIRRQFVRLRYMRDVVSGRF
jgi:hypothetical protein